MKIKDIAIASYLLCLFKQNDSFVDIGCGNGLLVYLLNEEGHTGYGVDLRRRKIWSRFENVDLREEAVLPESTYKVDWILGNHTDELTPWVPVISAR